MIKLFAPTHCSVCQTKLTLAGTGFYIKIGGQVFAAKSSKCLKCYSDNADILCSFTFKECDNELCSSVFLSRKIKKRIYFSFIPSPQLVIMPFPVTMDDNHSIDIPFFTPDFSNPYKLVEKIHHLMIFI